jgi:hypothetical protein
MSFQQAGCRRLSRTPATRHFRGWRPAVFPSLHAGRDNTEADTHRRFPRGCIFGPGCNSRRLHQLTPTDSISWRAAPGASNVGGSFARVARPRECSAPGASTGFVSKRTAFQHAVPCASRMPPRCRKFSRDVFRRRRAQRVRVGGLHKQGNLTNQKLGVQPVRGIAVEHLIAVNARRCASSARRTAFGR